MAVGRGALNVSFLLYGSLMGVCGCLGAGPTREKATPRGSAAVLTLPTLFTPLLQEGKRVYPPCTFASLLSAP